MTSVRRECLGKTEGDARRASLSRSGSTERKVEFPLGAKGPPPARSRRRPFLPGDAGPGELSKKKYPKRPSHFSLCLSLSLFRSLFFRAFTSGAARSGSQRDKRTRKLNINKKPQILDERDFNARVGFV